jgi:hypothetical protein
MQLLSRRKYINLLRESLSNFAAVALNALVDNNIYIIIIKTP